MGDTGFYDGTKLLSLSDINGDKPELYICTSNRSAGKTTYFNRLCVNKFKREGEKFCVIYRNKYELSNVAEKFFKDINGLFFPNDEMTDKKGGNGSYVELFLNELSCGYAVALNGADNLKKYSHLLSDTKRMVFDEFQSETNNYCSDEVRKFISIHTSIARGQGSQARYVPVYMISNPVTILNPYYVEMGISTRLQENTRFLRGEGFVLEQGYNEAASRAQKASGFNRAFQQNDYIAYSTESTYLNDNKAFVGKLKGKHRYLATIKYKGANFAIREFPEEGIIYCDDNPDMSYPVKIVVTTDDHDINYVMLRNNDVYIQLWRYYFDHGCFRFKDLRCKEAILQTLSY